MYSAKTGWVVQDAAAFNFSAGPGAALREFSLATGEADYVLFEGGSGETPWTQKLWIYDLRTNKHFTLKRNPLTLSDLEDFVACYNPGAQHNREESERFRSFAYDELAGRDKTNLDIFWLKDDSLEDTENLPPPDVLASTIVENLGAALEQFSGIQEEVEG